MKKLIFYTPLIFILIILQSNAEAVTIRLDAAGVWTGIDEVNINGSLWDASFLSGSFSSALPTIQTLTFATDAAFTVKDLFRPGGDFYQSIYDLNPLLALGGNACTENIFGRCWLATPYQQDEFGIAAASFANERGLVDHATTSWGIGINTVPDNSIWLEWAPSAVPIPAASWLFLSSLFGLFGWARYRN